MVLPIDSQIISANIRRTSLVATLIIVCWSMLGVIGAEIREKRYTLQAVTCLKMFQWYHFDTWVQNCSSSVDNPLELLQSTALNPRFIHHPHSSVKLLVLNGGSDFYIENYIIYWLFVCISMHKLCVITSPQFMLGMVTAFYLLVRYHQRQSLDNW